MSDPYIAASSQIDIFRNAVINSRRTLEIKFLDARDALRELPEGGANASEQSKIFIFETLSKTINILQEITEFLKEKQSEFQKVQCEALTDVIRKQRGRRKHRERKKHVQNDSGYGSIVSSSITGSYQSQTLQPISIPSPDGVNRCRGQQHDESIHIEELVGPCNIQDSESDEDNVETDEISKQNTLSSNDPTVHRRQVDIGVQTTFSSVTLANRVCGLGTVNDTTYASQSSTCKDFTNLTHKCEGNYEANVNVNIPGVVAKHASKFEKNVVPNEKFTHQNLEIKQEGTQQNNEDKL